MAQHPYATRSTAQPIEIHGKPHLIPIETYIKGEASDAGTAEAQAMFLKAVGMITREMYPGVE